MWILYQYVSEVLNLLVNLRPYPHLWSQALGSEQKTRLQIQAAFCQISFFRRVGGLSLRERVRSYPGGAQSRAADLHIERSQLRWFQYLIKMRTPKTRLREYIFLCFLGISQCACPKLEEVARERRAGWMDRWQCVCQTRF